MIGGAKPAAWTLFRIVGEARSAGRIGVGRRRRGQSRRWRFGSARSPAGDPLRYTHRADEVVHGRPAGVPGLEASLVDLLSAAFSNSASASRRLSVEFSARALSGASREWPSAHRTGYASGNTSASTPQARGRHPQRPWPDPASDPRSPAAHHLLRTVPLPRRHHHRAFLPTILGGSPLTPPGSTRRGQASQTCSAPGIISIVRCLCLGGRRRWCSTTSRRSIRNRRWRRVS